MSKLMRLCRGLLAVVLAVPLLPLQAQKQSAVDLLLNRIVLHEQEFLKNLRVHSPIIETYIQEMPVSDLNDTLPVKDHYFLGRLSLRQQRRGVVSREFHFAGTTRCRPDVVCGHPNSHGATAEVRPRRRAEQQVTIAT